MQLEQQIKICDLDEDKQEMLVAKGGKGGVGNSKKKSLQEVDLGKEGEKVEYELRLKTIADVGFIGFPNAGKSTLLSAITRAFPKIAPYPFTTLRPYVGLAKFVDDSKIVFADLPGIIEGAHLNKGLGHRFLQHAERTSVLLFVVDGSMEGDGRSPLNDYKVLRNEIKMYKEGVLEDKPVIVAVNKMDRSYTNFN